MQAINTFLDKNIEKIIIAFLCVQSLIDLTTSLMIKCFDINFTLGVIFRSMMLLIIGYYFIFVLKIENKKKFIMYILFITLYMFIYFINVLVFKDSLILFTELKYLIKTFYFPLMLIFLYNIFKYKKINIRFSYFALSVYLYIVIILMSWLTGTYFNSYDGYKMGTVGWFYAANEIGSIIAIMFPLLLLWVTKFKNKYLSYLILIVYIITSLQIGTKVPFLGIILSLFAVGVFYIANYIITEDKKNIVFLISPIIVISLFTFFVLPYTPIGENLGLHLKKVNVDSIDDFIHKDKNSDPMNVIYSSRDKYSATTKDNYHESSLWLQLTGIGIIEDYQKDTQMHKTIEMDFYDIFYRFGFFGFFIYFLFPGFLLYGIFRNFILNFKKCIANVNIIYLSISLVLGLAISFLAGHVLTAPAVSIYLIYVLVTLCNELEFIEK